MVAADFFHNRNAIFQFSDCTSRYFERQIEKLMQNENHAGFGEAVSFAGWKPEILESLKRTKQEINEWHQKGAKM